MYLISILLFSCSEEYNKDELSIQEDFIIENDLIKFESKAAFYNTYNEVKVIGAEIFYNTKIKVLGKEKFQSLHPFFGKDEEKELIDFLIKKKERNKNKLKKTFNKSENVADDDFIEVDDDIISDPNFAILLNENREIIVEGKLYRYQGDGVYILDQNQIPEFRSYISGDLSNNNYTEDDFGFQEMDYLTDASDEDEIRYGGGYGLPVPEPNLEDAKDSFEVFEFKGNNSLWGQTFGYARRRYVHMPTDKRIKIKFWNRNYVLFQSMGVEVRFQKKVSFLGITGWQKSYPQKIALGINTVQFNYKKPANDVLNPSVYNHTVFSFNGYNYFPNGTLAPYNLPSVPFPLAELLGGTNSVNVFITNPFSKFDFEVNISAEEYAKLINKATTALLKLGIKEIPAFLNTKPSTQSTILSTSFYQNATSVSFSNRHWLKELDNNITQYFDINVPPIGIKMDVAAPGEPFFSNTRPILNLTTDNYETGSLDFYAAVLHENVWYGARLVSGDFDR